MLTWFLTFLRESKETKLVVKHLIIHFHVFCQFLYHLLFQLLGLYCNTRNSKLNKEFNTKKVNHKHFNKKMYFMSDEFSVTGLFTLTKHLRLSNRVWVQGHLSNYKHKPSTCKIYKLCFIKCTLAMI